MKKGWRKPLSPLGFENAKQIADACGVTQDTARKWVTLPDFPAQVDGVWQREPVLQYGVRHMTEHANQIRGKDSDLKRAKLFRQVQKLEQEQRRAKADADKAERDAELHKIEYEARRRQWFSIEQVRQFALLVVQGFDDAQAAVEMATRDDKVSRAVQTEFDRIRKRLSKQVGEIK